MQERQRSQNAFILNDPLLKKVGGPSSANVPQQTANRHSRSRRTLRPRLDQV